MHKPKRKAKVSHRWSVLETIRLGIEFEFILNISSN
jgi:hypothetical protein